MGDKIRIIGAGVSYEKHLFGLEKQFEKEILRMKDDIFLGGYYERWDPLLNDELIDDGVQPDGLFVTHELDDWWIVEIELARDSKQDHIHDQLGRLERVNYTKYRDKLEKKLIKMGIVNANKIARNLCAERPNFLLIIDDNNQKIIERAKTRGFTTLILQTFKSPCGQVGIMMDNELPITRERDSENEPFYIISASDYNRNKLNADVWWYELGKNSPFSADTIEMIDKEGSFTVLIEKFGGFQHLRLPTDRKSIRRILKGNRIGNVFLTEVSERYELRADWPPL